MTTGYLGPTVMRQYSNSATLLALLDSFDQWVDLTKFTDDFLAYVWNIDTAQGFGLDILGRILGRSRYFEVAQSPGNNFGFNINVAVSNTFMGTGNGVLTTFSTRDQSGNVVTPLPSPAPMFYRQDWQGSQLLYSTARTNLFLRSTALTNAAWIRTRVGSLTAVLGPDGSLNAANLAPDGTGSGYIYQSKAVTAGQAYELSVFAQASASNVIQLVNFTQSGACQFTLAGAGSFTAPTGIITQPSIQALANGWYRCSVVMTPTATASNNISACQVVSPTGSVNLYGPQLLALGAGMTAPTSFIPTAGTTATVTDYTLAGSTLTLSSAPVTGAVVSWTGAYGFTGTQWQPWSQAPFFGGEAAGTVAFALDDAYYRKLLLVKAAANIAASDSGSINHLMLSMFGDRGLCFVAYDINNPMHIGYRFEFAPTTVERAIIESGLFPQPAGTTAIFVYGATSGFFGFAEQNVDTPGPLVEPFDQGIFYSP